MLVIVNADIEQIVKLAQSYAANIYLVSISKFSFCKLLCQNLLAVEIRCFHHQPN